MARRSAPLVGFLAAVLFLSVPALAPAAWEPARPISNQGAGFGNVASLSGSQSDLSSSDVVVGSNGLATALFFQSRDGAFRDAYFARRAAGDSAWAAPRATSLPAASSQ